jgi:hypothetical protein
MTKEKKNSSAIGGVVFAGCMFIGGGIGMIYDSPKVGAAIGIGVGFLAMAGVWMYYNTKNS